MKHFRQVDLRDLALFLSHEVKGAISFIWLEKRFIYLPHTFDVLESLPML